jgi:hypothetical protein
MTGKSYGFKYILLVTKLLLRNAQVVEAPASLTVSVLSPLSPSCNNIQVILRIIEAETGDSGFVKDKIHPSLLPSLIILF